MEDMSLYEVMDLIASYRGLAVQAWTMFISVHIAIIGGLFLVTKRVSLMERAIAFSIYAAFLWINYRAQVDYDVFITRLRAKAAWLESQVPHNAVPVADNIITTSPVGNYLPWVYGMALVLTGLTIFWINRISIKVAVEVHEVDEVQDTGRRQ